MLAPDRQKTKFAVLTLSDWFTLKQVRLAALDDSPKAFVTEASVERRLPDSVWRARIADGVWAVASLDGHRVAVAHLTTGQMPEPGILFIESVWVSPGSRRAGVVRHLIEELEKQARSLDAGELHLWVLEENHEAWQAYERLGFISTGENQPCLTGRGQTSEHRMAKKLI